jgi:hypothetical protein
LLSTITLIFIALYYRRVNIKVDRAVSQARRRHTHQTCCGRCWSQTQS